MASQQEISKAVRKWLQDANLSSHSIDLLILNGYTATDLFMVCNENDIEGIATDYNLPLLDKIKLKLAIHRSKNDNKQQNEQITNISNVCSKSTEMTPNPAINTMNKPQRNDQSQKLDISNTVIDLTQEKNENEIIRHENNENNKNSKIQAVSIKISQQNNAIHKKRRFDECNSTQQQNNSNEPQNKKKKLISKLSCTNNNQMDAINEYLSMPKLESIDNCNDSKNSNSNRRHIQTEFDNKNIVSTQIVNSNIGMNHEIYNHNRPLKRKRKIKLKTRHLNANNEQITSINSCADSGPLNAAAFQYETITQEMTKRGHKFKIQYHVSVHCHICSYYFVNYGKYREHLKKHYIDDPNKTWLHCDLLCKKIFTNNNGFIGHITTHTNEKPWRCDYPQCKTSHMTKTRLTQHHYACHIIKHK